MKPNPSEVAGPLSGIRILESCHMLAGPYCGMLMADLGADVIKIEPASGDIARRVGPHRVGPHNAYFASLNRNKRSIRLDLASAQGREQLGRLAATSHGLITNLRPSAIKKLGLTYEHLKRFNDRLVCVALTGYGLDGPFADRPAYDYVIQALTGVMAITGSPDRPPTKCGYSAVDNSAGILGVVGLLAKIIEGKGGQVDISLFDAMLSQLNYLASAYLNADEHPKRYANGGHPYIVPAQVFPTRDGHLALFISHDGFWRRFVQEVGRPEWLSDTRFATMGARTANRELVVAAVEELIATDDTARWVERLSPHGIVVAGVQTLPDALEGELARSRHMIITVPTPEGDIRLVGNPIKLSSYEPQARPPPLLGEHEHELLGYGHVKRSEIRARYIQGWYDLNADLLLETTSPEFIFDDPAEPEPVTRSMLADYMHRWDARTRALGSTNQWILSNEVREDKDGILTDWEWWELVGSGLHGTAIVQTSDEGVLSERITYFDRNIRHPQVS